MRKKLLNNISCFNANLKSSEDFHFYFRLSRFTSVGVINKVGLLRRLHGNNMSANKRIMFEGGIKSRLLLIEEENDPIIKKYLSKYIIECMIGLSRYYSDHYQHQKAFFFALKVFLPPYVLLLTKNSIVNLLRTIAIFLKLHGPPKNNREMKKTTGIL